MLTHKDSMQSVRCALVNCQAGARGNGLLWGLDLSWHGVACAHLCSSTQISHALPNGPCLKVSILSCCHVSC